MITSNEFAFPMNVIELLAQSLGSIDQEMAVHRRPLRSSDGSAAQCIGIFPTDWEPTPDSKEIRGATMGGGLGAPRWGAQFPTLTEYNVTIQSLVMDADEERGIATHSTVASMIRAMVARDQQLGVSLGQLASNVLGHREHFAQQEVRRQRFLTMEVSGSWIYMSVTQFWFQTQTS